jgi:predicted esterase
MVRQAYFPPVSEHAVYPHSHHLRVHRTARYFSVGDLNGGGVRTIWVVLHGHGQLAEGFIRYFADLAAEDAVVVAPEALNRYYLVGVDVPAIDRPVGATWMTREDRASEIGDYVGYLDALYDEVLAPAARAGAALQVIGFSQGAATATRWTAQGSAPVRRLILWGGLVPPDSDLSRGQASLRGAALTLAVGTRDRYVTAEMLAAEEARLRQAGVSFDVIRFDGGHAVSRSVFPQLQAAARPPVTGVSDR